MLDSGYQVVLAHALNDHGDGTRFGNEGLVVAILQCQICQLVTAGCLNFGIRPVLSHGSNDDGDSTRIGDDGLVEDILHDQVGKCV